METSKVFISKDDTTCSQCGAALSRGTLIQLDQKQDVLCLACAGLDQLVYLTSGNAALTRRAAQHSTRTAVVWRWSSRRKRNERQGILVTSAALDQANQKCLTDEESRARRQALAAVSRAAADEDYKQKYVALVRKLYPSCPPGREQAISGLTGMASLAARRAPPSPPQAKAIAPMALSSQCVFLAYAAATLGSRSVKIRRGHEAESQKNFRT